MLTNYMLVSAILFSLGAVGFLSRRNMIVMFLSAEMMLQGVSLNLVAFSNGRADWNGQGWPNWNGQIFAIFVLTVAAAEAGIALALVIALYRRRGSLDISLWQELREPGLGPITDEAEDEQSTTAKAEPSWPRLTPAGIQPDALEEKEE